MSPACGKSATGALVVVPGKVAYAKPLRVSMSLGLKRGRFKKMDACMDVAKGLVGDSVILYGWPDRRGPPVVARLIG